MPDSEFLRHENVCNNYDGGRDGGGDPQAGEEALLLTFLMNACEIFNN